MNSLTPSKTTFRFLDPGPLRDGDLSVSIDCRIPADLMKGWVPAYEFGLYLDGIEERVGTISFRAQQTAALLNCGGNIGYEVLPQFRGQHLAERGVRLLLPFIRAHEFAELWITCSPENIASRRTCERLGGHLVNIVDVPENSDMYAKGDRKKCRYRFDLS